jgi:hypothetical protein
MYISLEDLEALATFRFLPMYISLEDLEALAIFLLRATQKSPP